MFRKSKKFTQLISIRRELATVKKNIFTSFTEVASIYVQTEDDEKESIVEMETVINRAKYREAVELTDQLWSAFKGTNTHSNVYHSKNDSITNFPVGCSSFGDLKAAVEFALTCAAKYNIVVSLIPTIQP